MPSPTFPSPSPADASSGGPQQRSFNYLFYIDFVGSLADPQAQNALRHLQASSGAPGGEGPGAAGGTGGREAAGARG